MIIVSIKAFARDRFSMQEPAGEGYLKKKKEL
jgi:hypothetical protein